MADSLTKMWKKTPEILLVLLVALPLMKMADVEINRTVFVSSYFSKGGIFWRERRSVTVDSANPIIPSQLPGPADGWGRNERKEIILKAPYRRGTLLVLNLYESHDHSPPLIRISAGGHEVKRIQVKKGNGSSDGRWKTSGKRSSYEVLIAGKLLQKKNATISIKSLQGSWIAIENIVLKPQEKGWELWRLVPEEYAKTFLMIAVLLLVIFYGWRVTKRGLWRSAAINGMLIIFSVSITLIGVEFVLRNFFPQPLYESSVRIVYIPDEKIGYRLKPNVKTAVGFDTNSLGMRDYDRYSKSKPDGVFRILCLGDSFTYSLTKMEDSYPKYLERSFANSGKKVEALNAGGSGYGSGEEFKYLEAYGLDLEPDLILVAFYVGNDITDTAPGRKLTAVDGVLVPYDVAQKISKEAVSWEKRKRAILNDIHLYRFLKSRDYKALFKSYDEDLTTVLKRMNDRSGRCIKAGPSGVFRSPDKYTGIIRESWKNTIMYLDKFTELAKRRNIGLGIALIPTEAQFDHKEAVDLKKEMRASLNGSAFDWSYPQKALMELAEQRGWPMFDALPEMKKQGSGGSYYFCGDPHFNENGNRVFAGVLRDWITKKYGGRFGYKPLAG